jgi:ribosomal protein S18 acetylase RimI-like enzyme
VKRAVKKILPFDSVYKEELRNIFLLNTPDYFAVKELDDFEKYLHKNSHNYFVLQTQYGIIGGCGYKVSMAARKSNISWIFVHPSFKGQGYGHLLVNYCINLLKRSKDLFIIEVNTSQHAFKFFEIFGFTIVKIERDFWAESLDLYQMRMMVN